MDSLRPMAPREPAARLWSQVPPQLRADKQYRFMEKCQSCLYSPSAFLGVFWGIKVKNRKKAFTGFVFFQDGPRYGSPPLRVFYPVYWPFTERVRKMVGGYQVGARKKSHMEVVPYAPVMGRQARLAARIAGRCPRIKQGDGYAASTAHIPPRCPQGI